MWDVDGGCGWLKPIADTTVDGRNPAITTWDV